MYDELLEMITRMLDAEDDVSAAAWVHLSSPTNEYNRFVLA